MSKQLNRKQTESLKKKVTETWYHLPRKEQVIMYSFILQFFINYPG